MRVIKDDGKLPIKMWLDDTPRIALVEKGVLADIVVPPEKTQFKLLDMVKDTLTGFSGKVIALTTWNSGCVRVGVASAKLDKDGKPVDLWFSPAQLILRETAEDVKKEVKQGGPMNHPSCK